ncbi:ABC transporter substrate-binding protein [Ideonella livida]|uniref:ABC transporter substrate-binding protein n=1 Tax=Ideonella livida TaxID=2707176 RepID=UPI00194039C3|nr:ABC transporter substrate-binding protein [Ideonella livida]
MTSRFPLPSSPLAWTTATCAALPRRTVLAAGAGLAAGLALPGVAQAQRGPVRIGILGPFSGPFAHYGGLFKGGAEAYLASQGGKLGGHAVELLYRDTGGPNPAQTRSLVQELIVKDKVDYLGGFVFTPNALAAAPLVQQSQTPCVIFNAATSAITAKSDYFLRTSYTLWQVTVPLAQWAAKNGLKKVVTAVTDYGPGLDGEAAFKAEFQRQGGTVVESVRMPIATTDFTPFLQRLKASGAQAVYTFLPGGPPTLGFVKAYQENGLAKAGLRLLGTAETDEFDLPKLGDAALGLTTAFHYSVGARLGRQPAVPGGAGGPARCTGGQLRLGGRLGWPAPHRPDDRRHRRPA